MKTRIRTLMPLWALAVGFILPTNSSAQQALVYCPVGVDETGCSNIVAALGSAFPAGVSRAYDGSSGTVDLRTVDIWEYSVLVVPSLADGSGKTPYALLRDPAVVSRLKNAVLGRVALWSGSPDLGTSSRTEKNRLLTNLTTWASAHFGVVDGPGLVALQDLSADVSQRYNWLAPLIRFQVVADPVLQSYGAVRTLTANGSQILQGPSGQLAYTNMASLGYMLPAGGAGASLDAVGQTGTSTGGQIVLLTAPGGNTGTAIIYTNKDDYAPGETVSIFGAGWAAGESVTIVLHEDPLVHSDRTLTAVAGPDGKFVNTSFSPETHHIGVRFIATATGTSGVQAQTTFTDGNRIRFSTTATGDVVTTFGTITPNQCVSAFVQERQGDNLDEGDHPSRSVVLSSVAVAAAQFYAGAVCGGSTITSVTIPANQPSVGFSFKIAATGSYTVKGTDSGLNDQNNASATVTVANAANTAPVANNDTYSTNEDTPLTVAAPGVLGNDTDAELNPLTAVLVTGPTAAQGTLTLNSNGSFTFTPTLNFNGPATFTYRANDGSLNSNTATVTINVTAVNDAPVANPESYNAIEDQPLNVLVANGVLLNDTDVDGNALTAVIVTQPPVAEGSVTLNANGSFTFNPAANFFGSTSFTYKANDGTVDSAPATVTIIVAPVNDAPSFTKGADVTVNEDSGAHSSAWATAISAGPANESSQTVSFVITNNTNATLFSAAPAVSSTGVLTFTPAANAHGNATITLKIQDDGGTANSGVNESATQSFLITVSPVNDAPTFDLIASHTSLEDAGAQSIANALTNANANESGQTLTITVTNDNNGLFSAQPSIDLSTGTLTYTAAPNKNGSAIVTVKLNDGGGTANGGIEETIKTLTINVTAVNDEPTFIKGANQTTNEDAGAQTVNGWATAISAGPADEAGQTLTFNVSNNNNALFSAQPAVSATGVLTYTAAPNAFGSATVTLNLSDNGGVANSGHDTSDDQTFTITINPVNDAPTFNLIASHGSFEDGGAQSVPNALTAPSAGPSNESSQTLTLTVTNDNNPLFSVQPAIDGSGTLTYTAAANKNGSAIVTVKLKDNGGTDFGGVDETTKTLTITVTAVNDAPNFTKGADQTTNEDAGAQTVNGWATAISAGPADESSQTLTFNVSNNNNALFSAQPAVSSAGVLTYTAAPNQFGSATVTLNLSDNGGIANGGDDISDDQTFTITINPVNDAPTYDLIASDAVLEDSGARTVPNALTNESVGPANEVGQTLTVSTSNNNSSLFSVQPTISLTTHELTYTPAANANGTATVTVKVNDGGGTDNGGVQETTKTLTITVTAVNDAPSFIKGGNQTSNEDAGAQTVTGWATAISAGPADEASQTLTFTVTNGNPTLFSVQPAVAANGTLSYTPAPDQFGTANLTIKLKDNGGTLNNGVDSTLAQTFTITVNSVNDAPTYTLIAGHTSAEDAVAQSVSGALTGASPGPSNESSQTLTITVSNDNNALFSSQPAIDLSTGTLAYTAAANKNGSATVTVVVKDNGLTANGGQDTTTKTLTITITKVNDGPVITAFSSPDVPNPLNTQVLAIGTFTDPDLADSPMTDSYTGTINWGDGVTTSVTIMGSGATSRSFSGSHAYTAAGVYNLVVEIEDAAGATDTETFSFVVVYDPSAGFVTGGGFIQSTGTACQLTTACVGATGKANFGFVSKYLKGANTPTGNTEFQFHAGNLNFKSSVYEWLVVSGARAQYKGTGTINGSGNYGFMLTAVDGQVNGGGNVDKFRIKIWDINDNDKIVYDNEMGASDTGTPSTAIAGGSIVIHSK